MLGEAEASAVGSVFWVSHFPASQPLPRLKGTLSSALIGGIQAGQAFRIPTETQSPVEPWGEGERDLPPGSFSAHLILTETLTHWPASLTVVRLLLSKSLNTEASRQQTCSSKSIKVITGTSLVAQWLGHCISTAGGADSIPGRGTAGCTARPKIN